MAKVSMSTELQASADEVWKLIGHFNALPDWHPAVAESELAEGGEMRTLTLIGGGEIVEKLERIDDETRTYSYTFESGPLPVANYRAEITVHDEGEVCSVQWSSEFDAFGVGENEALKVVENVYQVGLDTLTALFGPLRRS